MKTDAPARRPTLKCDSVVNHVRQLIVSGKLRPGARLPTYSELERHLDAETQTICNALSVLRRDGFIETQPRRGTFVVPHPPHLSHFALAFPFPVLKGVSRFYEAIRDEAAKLQAPERRVSTFYDIESRVDVDDYQRLMGFVRAHRLAGLIFAANPGPLEYACGPLIHEPGVFRTAIMMPVSQFFFPSVYPEIPAFLPKAFDYLASRGRKRVAVVSLGETASPQLGPVQALAAERGLILRPHWMQAGFATTPEWSRQSALMLLHEGQTERPDAVVITDDNLVEGFTAGIRDSGMQVGVNGAACGERSRTSDLEVVAQANFPYPTPSHVPAKRLGYNITQLVVTCLERIEQQRRGEDAPPHTAIPAEWEGEP